MFFQLVHALNNIITPNNYLLIYKYTYIRFILHTIKLVISPRYNNICIEVFTANFNFKPYINLH